MLQRMTSVVATGRATPSTTFCRRTLASSSSSASSLPPQPLGRTAPEIRRVASYEHGRSTARSSDERQRLAALLRHDSHLDLGVGSSGGAAAAASTVRVSPSYFTGRPLLHDTMYQLDRMLKTHYALVTRVQDDPLLRDRAARSQPAWIPHEVLEEAWNFGVPRMDYRRMVEKLSALHGVATAIEVEQEKAATAGMREQPAETADLATTREDTVLEALVTPAQAKAITALINQFKRPGTGGLRQRVNPGLDEWGRAYAPGYRRRVKAHVWVVASSEPGNGRVMIDGEDMTDVLERVVDRARVMAPFEVTDTVGRFNVWCELEVARKDVKPGPTGISGALANGIANALLLHNAGFESWLEEANLLKPDLRQHERKKPGQPGARAKFQWVKR